jgi:Phage tail assembly chaperone protein, TAC
MMSTKDGPLVFGRGERRLAVDLFSAASTQLCGQCALLLGWRPAEFWNATPAELACILNAMTQHAEAPPDTNDLQKLMELFPDAPTGGD